MCCTRYFPEVLFCLLLLFSAIASADRLRSLTVNDGTLSPSFSGRTLNYTVHVPNSTSEIILTAEARRARSTITLNGEPISSGVPTAPIELNVGDNVLALDVSGRNLHTYTVVVNREGSTGNQPPEVTISSPRNGEIIQTGTLITFSATASDVEDGDLSQSVSWTSSADGFLGIGDGLTLSLSNNIHTITASVQDSANEQGTDEVTITVTDIPQPAWSNILLIIADDLGAESVSLYPDLVGNSGAVSMPNIETLAQRGITFDNAWANPACSPTRGTIVSGEYGHNNGVVNVGGELQSNQTTSIFELISSTSPANYRMAVYGKWHLGPDINHIIANGVTEFKGFFGGAISDYFNWQYTDINGQSTNTTEYSTTLLTDFAIDFIQDGQGSEEPWFVYLAYNAPHGVNASTGFQVPPEELHSVDVGGLSPGDIEDSVPVYKAMVQAMDTEIGRLLTALGSELDNTLVIFIGDNGTPSAVKDTGSGVRRSKGSVYEGGVRVPLVIAGPGVTRINERESDVAMATDLYATIASVAGIGTSQIGNSYNLEPLFSNDSGNSGRDVAFTELCNNNDNYALRNQQFKLMYTNNTWRLYDLLNDTLEQTNLYSDPSYSTERTDLQNELDSIVSNAGSYGCFQ